MIPVDTIPAPRASAPHRPVPVGACDAHTHVFGPFDRFPPLQPSVYALPDASPVHHARMRHTIGVERGVLVQPAPYGDDPSAMLEAIAGSNGALKGIAVASPEVQDETLERWKSGGIVGLRFNEMRAPGGGRYPGSIGVDALLELAPRMRALGLHAQIWANVETLVEQLPHLERLGVRIVLDHMACPIVERGSADPIFQRLLTLISAADIWVKLSVCRVSKNVPGYADARPFHDAFMGAAPQRCIWGSDWPYVRMSPEPDAGRLCDLVLEWCGDADTQRRVLVDNPSRLYGFTGDA